MGKKSENGTNIFRKQNYCVSIFSSVYCKIYCFAMQKSRFLEFKVAISAFRRNYLCIIDVVLCHGKYKGCGVYIRFNAVVSFVVPSSSGFSSEVR